MEEVKRDISINYNKKTDIIYLDVYNADKFPHLHKPLVEWFKKAFGVDEEKAEQLIAERKNWKEPFAVLFDENNDNFFAIESEALYATMDDDNEMNLCSPYDSEVKVSCHV